MLLAAAAVLGALVLVPQPPTTAVRGAVATVWMSGEARGRVVLAAARSERPSVGIELDAQPSSFDLADIGTSVLVHDRLDGSITVLDGRDGLVVSTGTGPVPIDDRRALVAAGDVAYLVNAAANSIEHIAADGTRLAAATIAKGMTDWVAASDGVLWYVDSARGAYGSFDGESVTEFSLTTPDVDLVLTAVGPDPVVYDPSTRRMRWLRRSTSIEVPGADSGAVVVQDPTAAAECVAVIAGTTMSCIGRAGVVRTATVAAVNDPETAQLMADDSMAVIVHTGSPSITMVAWADGSAATFQRSEPSARRLVGSTSSGTIVIDDPGSRFAVTVTDGGVIPLDKFSRRTVVIGPDGSAAEGVGTLDENAIVAGIFADDDAGTPRRDDNLINDPPVAFPDTITTRTGRSVDIGVLANDVDPDGDPLSVIEAGPLDPADGVVTIVEGSRINYASPDASTDRTITFGYRIADVGNLESESAVTVEIIGSGRNSPPTLSNDRAVTATNTSVDIPVLDNDTDAEGDPLTVSSLDQPANGSSAIGEDGVLRYEPTSGFHGKDEFAYTAVDGYGGESTARVQVTVEAAVAANRAPIAFDDRASTAAGQRVRIDVLENDRDPDGDSLRLLSVQSVPGLTITIASDQGLDVNPGPTVAGLIAFEYLIADAQGFEDAARVTLFVEPLNTSRPPTAVDDFVTSASVPTIIDVVSNDIDPTGSQLIVTSWTQPPSGRGSVSRLNPTSLHFVPVIGSTGTVRFTYTVVNVAGLSATATVAVEVTPRSGSTPVARNDSVQIFPGEIATVRVLDNDTHPDGLPFDFAGPPTTRDGTAAVNADRAIVFRPPDDSLATYVITYTIEDSFGAESRATLSVTVAARPTANVAPIALPDLQTAAYDTSIVIDVLNNDVDPDGDELRIISIGPPTQGRAEIVTGKVRYTPPLGFSGAITFNYAIADPDGDRASATVTVSVLPRVEVPPIAEPDLVSLITGASATIFPLANDSDPDGAPASLRITALGTPSPAGGISVANLEDSVRVWALAVPGTYVFSYVISDRDGQTATQRITVVVQPPPNAPPLAEADSYSVLSVPSTFSVLDNDLDPDGGALTLASVGQPVPAAAGSTAISGNQVIFTPIGNFSGSVRFSYTVRDAQNGTGTGLVTVSVQECPVVPVLAPIAATTRFETPITVALFGDTGSVGRTTQIVQPAVGAASLNSSGSAVTYTPATGFNGNVGIGYSMRTICGAIANGVVTVTVNRSPLAASDQASTGRNQDVSIPVLANDTDPDGDVLRVVSVEAGVNGTPRLSGGIVTFSPARGVTGAGSFSYRIADIGGLTSTATVSVAIANAAPVATSDVAATSRQVAISIPVLANDTDTNSDELSLAAGLSITSPAAGGGSVASSGNNVVYTPGTYLGTVVVVYSVTDGIATTNGTLTITVSNRPPVTSSDAASLDLATASTVSVDVLANDNDPDGPVAGLSLTGATTQASFGTVSFTGNGVITFTRATSLTAPATVIISYSVADADGGMASGTLTITVNDTTPPPPTTGPPPPPTTAPPPPPAPPAPLT